MSTNYSITLTTTPVQIVPAVSSLTNPLPRTYIRIVNVNAAGGSAAWLSHFGTTPAANTAGSYPILAGNLEEFNSSQDLNLTSYCPQGAIWGVAASGTVPLTVEVSAA